MGEERFAISSGDELLDVIHKSELQDLMGLKHFETLTITPFDEYTKVHTNWIEDLGLDEVPF